MRRQLLWIGLVAVIVLGALGVVRFVENSAAQKGEISITGKK